LKEATFGVPFVFRREGVEGGEEELKSISNELTVVIVCQYRNSGLSIISILIILYVLSSSVAFSSDIVLLYCYKEQNMLESTTGTFVCGSHS